ncbi:MAG: tetratricopeptide repeat protein [Candidatus Obscuribacterales bacterium]|nr:tetratricopeptide repeat protein [Candidatus Obscuribacterales bacterium]
MKMKSIKAGATIVFVLASICLPSYGQGQVQTWNTKARERSQAFNSSAMTALKKKQDSTAVSLLNKAVVACPDDPVPLATLGLVLAKQGKYGEALDALGKSYDLKHDATTLLTTGFVYYLEHDYEAAIKSWNKLLEKNPTAYEVYGDLGYAYLRQGNFEKAEECFKLLAKQRPSSQLAYQGLAQLKYLSGNLSASKQAAVHACSIAQYGPLIFLLAKVQMLEGNKAEASKLIQDWLSGGKPKYMERSMTALGYPLQQDIQWDPYLVDCYDNGYLFLARAQSPQEQGKRKSFLAKGKVSVVLSQVEKASEANPEDFYLLRERALVEMAAGKYKEAAEHLSSVLQICPSGNLEWLHLGLSQFRAGQELEAGESVGKYLAKYPRQKLAGAFMNLVQKPGLPIPEPDQANDGELPVHGPKTTEESGF